MSNDVSVRIFRDELNREWEVRVVRDTLTERRQPLLPRPELAGGWLLFRLGEERRRLAPFPPGWFVASDVQLTRWCDDAEPATRAVPRQARSSDRRPCCRGMVSAHVRGMALKTLRAPDGMMWTVWLVEAGNAMVVPGSPSAWLAFQNEDGEDRRRLIDFPDDWAQLSDQLLDLLRRMAEPVVAWRRTLPTGVDHPRRAAGPDRT